MTIWVAVGVAMVPVGPLPLIVTPKVPAEVVKKPDGYVSVILLPIASAPPAVVVNENVAAAAVLPATRSADAITKLTLETRVLQAVDDVLPKSRLNEPAGHAVQVTADAPPVEKEPGWQSPLTAPSPPAHHLPAVHDVQVTADAPPVEKEPGWQGPVP